MDHKSQVQVRTLLSIRILSVTAVSQLKKVNSPTLVTTVVRHLNKLYVLLNEKQHVSLFRRKPGTVFGADITGSTE